MKHFQSPVKQRWSKSLSISIANQGDTNFRKNLVNNDVLIIKYSSSVQQNVADIISQNWANWLLSRDNLKVKFSYGCLNWENYAR